MQDSHTFAALAVSLHQACIVNSAVEQPDPICHHVSPCCMMVTQQIRFCHQVQRPYSIHMTAMA